MKEKGSLEIISFNQVETAGQGAMNHGFQILDTFYKGYEGYYGMDIAMVGEGQWTLVLRWASRELEKEASSHMVKSDKTKPFMSLVNPKTVNKRVYPWMGI